jgi:hypothetical protein
VKVESVELVNVALEWRKKLQNVEVVNVVQGWKIKKLRNVELVNVVQENVEVGINNSPFPC